MSKKTKRAETMWMIEVRYQRLYGKRVEFGPKAHSISTSSVCSEKYIHTVLGGAISKLCVACRKKGKS